jgi:hypothetical protein
MKKQFVTILCILGMLFTLSLISNGVMQMATDMRVSPYVIIGASVLLYIIYRAFPKHRLTGVQKNDINLEVWVDTLIKLYWKDNAFAKTAMQVLKEYIYNSKIVHIPKVNGKPGVTRNRTEFPATVQLRQEIDILYLIDQFFVDPFRIPNAEKYELSFDKRASLMADQSAAANEKAAEWLIYNWNSYTQTNNAGTTTMKAQLLRTTGGDVATTLDGATGMRKMPLVADLRRAKVLMNKASVPLVGRYGLFDSDMIDRLTQDPEYKKVDKVNETALVEGTVAKIQGFNIIERATVGRYTNDATPTIITPDALSAETTNASGLLYHSNGVETAMGGVEWFDDAGNPLYYGDIMSCILRSGGRLRREDSVIALVEAAPAA